MELNQFLFPAPIPSYTSAAFIGELIYVPKYARNPQTNEVVQFKDPTAEKADLPQSVIKQTLQERDPSPAEGGRFERRPVSPGTVQAASEAPPFTKEELALMSIRDEAVHKKPATGKQAEERKSKEATSSFERHVSRMNMQRGDKAKSEA